MDAAELATLVEELELRVERLRILYDQYFMGIEKIPPDVLKKDVERRMWVLRKEKIRNTGTRFKFQQITQRLNTFGSYWMRICRDIENGTYKRDVIRAKKRFGIVPNKATVADVAKGPGPGEDYESIALDDFDIELEEPESSQKLDEPMLEEEFPALFPDTPRPMEAAKPQLTAKPVLSTAARGAPPPAPTPSRPQPPSAPVAKPQVTPPRAGAPAGTIPATTAPQPAAVAAKPAHDPRSPFAPRAPTPRTKKEDDLDAMLDDALGDSMKPAPRAPAIAKPPEKPAPPQPAPIRASAPQSPGAPRAPLGARIPIGERASAAKLPTAPVAPPQAAPQPIAPKPIAAATPPRTSAPTPPRNSRPDDPDRAIYSKYVDAKRQNGESTAGITYENLAKNLAETRERLKAKSGGRNIDFDVVVKDGKTILKPTVK